jgi:hypothetical protein
MSNPLRNITAEDILESLADRGYDSAVELVEDILLRDYGLFVREATVIPEVVPDRIVREDGVGPNVNLGPDPHLLSLWRKYRS